jgi:hypothetical protein
MDWLESFERKSPESVPSFSRGIHSDVDQLIEAAKREAYTPCHGETRPRSSLIGKEERDGAHEEA